MREINKLVHLVTGKLNSSFGVIDLSGQVKNPGKEQQLYNGVLNGEYHNDEVTAAGMYQSNVYDQRFRMLKSRLRYKLYDLLYYLDFETPDFSFTVQKKMECLANLHKAHILFELGELDMAEKQYNKVIVLAGEYQFTEELINALELKRKVLSKEHKPTDFEQTVGKLQNCRSILQKEKEAEDLFLRMELLLGKSIHSRNVSLEANHEAISKLQSLYEETNSYNIFEQLHNLRIWSLMLAGSNEELEAYLKKIYSDQNSLKGSNERYDHQTHFHILAQNYLMIGNFEKGLEAVNQGLSFTDKSTERWFYLHELQFLLGTHAQNYDIAYKAWLKVSKNPNFDRVSETVSNRWKVFKIYLNFAMPEKRIQKRIRFYDIYEASDSCFKELKEYRISMYLLEFIHQVNKGSYDQAVNKLEELEAFFYKNLNDPGKNQREKQLIKMIKMLRTNNFRLSETKEGVQAYFKKMGEKKVDSHFSDFEIIPYEDLWNLMLRAVENNPK